MPLRVLIFSVCFVSASLLQAQYNDLLRDPDIIWVAEYTTDFVMNPENEDIPYYETLPNSIDLIRLQNTNAENGLYDKTSAQKYLSQAVLQKAKTEDVGCFKDSLLQLPLSREALISIIITLDTTIGFNHPWDTIISANEVTFDQIKEFRVRQIFWYNQKNRTFDSRFLAYAPVVDTKDYEGNINGIRTLFWLKADESTPKRLENKRFSYIFQTKMRANAPRFEDFKVLKGNLDFRTVFAQEIKEPSHPCFDMYDYKPVSAIALFAKCYIADTIVTFDPATYEEKIRVEQRDCIEQIERIRFVQNWYYDERRNRFYARLVGIAPLAAIRDNEGEFRYYKPLFYQMYR